MGTGSQLPSVQDVSQHVLLNFLSPSILSINQPLTQFLNFCGISIIFETLDVNTSPMQAPVSIQTARQAGSPQKSEPRPGERIFLENVCGIYGRVMMSTRVFKSLQEPSALIRKCLDMEQRAGWKGLSDLLGRRKRSGCKPSGGEGKYWNVSASWQLCCTG